MNSNQNLRGVWAVVLLCCVPAVSAARTKIPYSTITTNGAVTSDQLSHIGSYLDERIPLLLEGDKAEVVRARRELIEPLSWAGGTTIFHLAYSSATANRLPQAIKADRLLVRHHAWII